MLAAFGNRNFTSWWRLRASRARLAGRELTRKIRLKCALVQRFVRLDSRCPKLSAPGILAPLVLSENSRLGNGVSNSQLESFAARRVPAPRLQKSAVLSAGNESRFGERAFKSRRRFSLPEISRFRDCGVLLASGTDSKFSVRELPALRAGGTLFEIGLSSCEEDSCSGNGIPNSRLGKPAARRSSVSEFPSRAARSAPGVQAPRSPDFALGPAAASRVGLGRARLLPRKFSDSAFGCAKNFRAAPKNAAKAERPKIGRVPGFPPAFKRPRFR